MSTTPFKIRVSDDRLDRLKQKLALTELPRSDSSGEEDSWQQGPPLREITRLARVWQTTFDWREVELWLNSFPQYVTQVDIDGHGTYQLHHIHQKSTRTDALPLLFLHGWPGSFIEVTRIINDLVQGPADQPAFHVVAPSLIDFGFSSPSKNESFGVAQHAEAYDKLMLELGYSRYVVQGGDLGSMISRFMAQRYGPDRLKAYHINTAAPLQPDQETHPELYSNIQSVPLSDAEKKGLERGQKFANEGFGYYKQQSTKPRTIGYSLKDSPVGLLAWIFEKLHDWSHVYSWTDGEVLAWVSIYYFSTSGADASSNIYYAFEHMNPPAFVAQAGYIDVPLGISRFLNDIAPRPKLWNQSLGPIIFENEHEVGGHFAAWEKPEVIVGDLREMFGEGGKGHAIAQAINK